MKKIWVVQYNDGTANVYDSEQEAPALPYIDAFEVQNRIAELEAQFKEECEQSYAAGFEAKCPLMLRRIIIDGMHKRIAELEKALATLMDEYLCRNGFDTHYYAAAVALCF